MGCSVSSVGDPCKDCNELEIIRSDCPHHTTTTLPAPAAPVVDDDRPEEVFEDLSLTEAQLDNIRSSWLRLLPNLTAVGKQVTNTP